MTLLVTNDDWLVQADVWQPVLWDEFEQAPVNSRVAVPLGTCEGWRLFKNKPQFYKTGNADTGWMEFVATELRAAKVPHALGLMMVPDRFSPSFLLVKQFAVTFPSQRTVDVVMPGLNQQWDKVTSIFQRIHGQDAP